MLRPFALATLLVCAAVLPAEDPVTLPEPRALTVTRPEPSAVLPPEVAKLKEEREALAVEREKLSKLGTAAAGVDAAELARQRRRLSELLERLEQRSPEPRGPVSDPPPIPVRPPPVTDPADPRPVPVTGREDPFLLAQAQFRAGLYEDALAAYRRIDPEALGRDERVTVQFLSACCLRKLGKLEEAAALYREVADAREDDFLTECALWHLAALGWRRDVEKQLAESRKTRQER